LDLVDTLRKKIDALGTSGEFAHGLKSVLLHIETAFRHLSRGIDADDDTAFTDAIYRTNQAFEGSVKEAYRVLAGKDPSKTRPFDIETYLEGQQVFRNRVLKQMTTYRTEWRNPSTHDYKLDFDESEAFLAIISVSAFACLLLDEIAERVSYNASREKADAEKQALAASLSQTANADLLTRISDLISEFCVSQLPVFSSSERQTESQVIGALHGFFASTAQDLTVGVEERLVEDKPFRGDMLIKRGDERVVVEIKRRFVKSGYQNAIAQVEHYLLISGLKSGILLFLPEVAGAMTRREIEVKQIGARLVVLQATTTTV
jgi:hypothetical protein